MTAGRYRRMPLHLIPYPRFDPVLVHLGPLAIRWYALAYIVGILAGWVYARAIIRNDRLWAADSSKNGADHASSHSTTFCCG